MEDSIEQTGPTGHVVPAASKPHLGLMSRLATLGSSTTYNRMNVGSCTPLPSNLATSDRSQFPAPRGHAGQPGPRAENRERGKTETRWNLAIACPTVYARSTSPTVRKLSSPSRSPRRVRRQVGARNDVPRRTAYRWANEPKVRTRSSRIAAAPSIGPSVGWPQRVTWAADGIAKLAENAASESVRLAALRAILSDMMAVSDFAGLEERITEIEEQLDDTALRTRVGRAKASPATVAAPGDRPLALGLVRRILLVRPAARGVPRHPRARPTPAAPRGRLAGLGLRGRSRGGQDARRRLLDSAAGRGRHHEARLPDRPDRRRYSRRDGRGPLGADRGRAARGAGPGSNLQSAASTWPNGARAVCLSGEEPERARGLNIDTLWADELACWQRAESTWDLAMLALRAGTNPQAMITTTPRRVAVLRRILAEATTVRTTDTTYANQAHLPPRVSRVRSSACMRIPGWAGRRSTPSFWRRPRGSGSPAFDPARHVSLEAEFHPAYFVRCAIDAGTSRHTAAVFFQVRHQPDSDRKQRDGLWRVPRRRRGEPEERPRDPAAGRSIAVPRADRPGPP